MFLASWSFFAFFFQRRQSKKCAGKLTTGEGKREVNIGGNIGGNGYSRVYYAILGVMIKYRWSLV